MNHIGALLIHTLIIMALISGTKLLIANAPDSGVAGDVKKFFMNA